MASTLQSHYERNREYFAKFRASVTGLKEFNFETVRAWQQIAQRVKELLEMESHEGIALDITAEEDNPPREVTLYAEPRAPAHPASLFQVPRRTTVVRYRIDGTICTPCQVFRS